MSTITVDPNMLSVLRQVKEATDIVDDTGKVVGTFTPKGKTNEDVIKLFDLDKARARFEREKGQGRPLQEILDRLHTSEKQG